jgi:PmbA protein
VVENGLLQGYFLSSYTACKLGMTTTGNAGGAHNLILEADKKNFDDLVRQMHRGLIVSELMGHGVNLVTGDYSKGAAGYWVENGTLAYPVEEITIAGNLKEMFAHIIGLGSDEETFGAIHTGSVLIENMTIAGA